MLERIWKGFGEDFGEGFGANAARPTSTIKLLASNFLEPIDELMESRPWILQIHDPRTIVLLSRQQFVEEHPLMTTHLKDAPMVLFEVILEFGKCTWVSPEDPCTIGTIHLCNFGEGVPSVLAMAHHHIIVLEPKRPCEQEIIH